MKTTLSSDKYYRAFCETKMFHISFFWMEMFHEAEMFHECFPKDWEANFRRGRVVLEKFDNAIRYKEGMRTSAGKCLSFAKILAAVNQEEMAVKQKKVEAGVWLFVFGASDRKILTCYRTYWGSARNTQDSGAMLKRMMCECMEETLFAQYEKGMALFCLIAEGLPGSWQPGVDVKKRIKEKVRPLITAVEDASGTGGFKRKTG